MRLCAVNIDPIFKKPLYHFYPNAPTLSIATVSCNFRCEYCCNFEISQVLRNGGEIIGRDYKPADIVEMARRYDCPIITETYTEPTIFFEVSYDVNELAHKNHIKCTWVTNGYATPEAVRKIAPYLDAATVDFKGSANPEFYRKHIGVTTVEPIFECLKEMKRQGIHIEITDLIIPKIGDSLEDVKSLAQWVREHLGRNTPFHVLRFHPQYKLIDLPSTPVTTLEKAREAAMEFLDYVFVGNVPGHLGEHTYCPNCKEVVIKRFGFELTGWYLDENFSCRKCGYKLPIVGKYWGNTGSLLLPVV